jgi:type IV pilus assembly protein PilV
MKSQAGLIMMEVLVSIVIVAIGLLGLISLQLYALKAAHTSTLRSSASDLARDITERIRAMRPPKLAVQDSPTQSPNDENGNKIALPPDFAKLACDWNSGSSTYVCALSSDYESPSGQAVGSQVLANADMANWLNLVRRTLPLGVAMICRDDSPDDGTTPLESSDPNYVATTGCILPDDTTGSPYQRAPYVVKIWWQDIKPSKDNPTPGLTRFTTSF